MIYVTTYASDNMSRSRDLALRSAQKFGATPIHAEISSEFYLQNFDTLNHPRGAGYWLWKPYIIDQCLSNMDENDVLLYIDAGVEVVDNIQHLVDAMDQDIMIFGNHYRHVHWCKREVYVRMFALDKLQAQASAIVIKATKFSRNFVREWLLWSQMPNFINDVLKVDQFPEFQEHRHDQAILTCLQQWHGLKLHWWPAMYNDGAFIYDKGTYMDTYPVIFHHHRKRNEEW